MSRPFASLCLECGPDVRVDEDGCCAGCGATAMGTWLEENRRRLRLAPPPIRPVSRKQRKKQKQTADVREAVVRRAGGVCECGCGRAFVLGGPEMDHFWGRGRDESVESCWALRQDCHFGKTNNRPSARAWVERFRAHAIRHSLWGEAHRAGRRLTYLEAKERLAEARR